MGRSQESGEHPQAWNRLQRCTGAFQNSFLTLRDGREDYGEERWICLGRIRSLIGVVVYTERQGDVIRVISARKATRQEAGYYVQNIEN